MSADGFYRNHVLQAFGHPMREVVRTGVSPMNPKVKYAELKCGHDVYLPRKPKVGSFIACDKCPSSQDGAR